MPWQECSKMDERLRFVARLLEGEKMAVLCREFDISRKTGYKLFSRLQGQRRGRTDRSQPPTLSTGLPTALPDRELDLATEARVPELGGAEDPREDPPQAQRDPTAGDQHRACRAR